MDCLAKEVSLEIILLCGFDAFGVMCRAEIAYFELGLDGVREAVEKDIERFDAAMEGVFVAEEGVKKPFCARDSRSRRRRADAESNLRKAIIIISSFDFAIASKISRPKLSQH